MNNLMTYFLGCQNNKKKEETGLSSPFYPLGLSHGIFALGVERKPREDSVQCLKEHRNPFSNTR